MVITYPSRDRQGAIHTSSTTKAPKQAGHYLATGAAAGVFAAFFVAFL
jgi:hypothetical protein